MSASCPVLISGTSTLSYCFSTSATLAGNGDRCRRWAWAIEPPASLTRRTAAPIEPNVEPQPRTSTRALPSGSSTSSGGGGGGGRAPVDLRLPQPDHLVVVVGVVGDVARAVGLLDPADPVLEPGRAGNRPRPGQGARVALERQERRPAGVPVAGWRRDGVRELGPQVRQIRHLGNPPGL